MAQKHCRSSVPIKRSRGSCWDRPCGAEDVPGGAEAPCNLIYETGEPSSSFNLTGYRKRDEVEFVSAIGRSNQGVLVSTSFDNTTGQVNGVDLAVPGAQVVFLDLQCTRVLIYPDQV